jgi:hypothetical protein
MGDRLDHVRVRGPLEHDHLDVGRHLDVLHTIARHCEPDVFLADRDVLPGAVEMLRGPFESDLPAAVFVSRVDNDLAHDR